MKTPALRDAGVAAFPILAVLAACGGDGSSANSSGARGTVNGDASSGSGSSLDDASASFDSSTRAGSGSSGAGSSGSGSSGAGSSGGGGNGDDASSLADAGASGDTGSQPPCGAALPAPSAGSGVALQVDACAARHAISNDIYGATFFWGNSDTAELQFAKDIRLPLNRLGGDATTRYNWQVDASNSGFDWYFMAGGSGSSPVPGASDDAIIGLDEMVGAGTIITIPIIDFINKNSASSCSYPMSLYPTQDKFNPYSQNCGNGESGGKPIANTNVSDHDIPNDPSIQTAWIQHLVGKFGSAAHGGVRIYEMDNEPTGWPGIHFDVRPNAPSCTELQQRTVTYASAVKAADPTAAVLGPDDIPVADDFDCSGTPDGAAYMAAMAAYEKAHGTRILDYYSHHYPGCCSGDPIANAEQRIQKHQGWIAKYYPGTKLGYDEYNWGAGGDSTTFPEALMAVDGLGLFGSYGVDLANFWGLSVTTPTATAFRLYRDYDGHGASFGDTSISATSSDTSRLRVYAASRTADGAATIVVVNRTSADVPAVLALSNHTPKGNAGAFLFSSAQPMSVVAQPATAITDPGKIAMTFAANTATLLVVP